MNQADTQEVTININGQTFTGTLTNSNSPIVSQPINKRRAVKKQPSLKTCSMHRRARIQFKSLIAAALLLTSHFFVTGDSIPPITKKITCSYHQNIKTVLLKTSEMWPGFIACPGFLKA